jgi:glucose-1-phosphatase
MEGLGLSRTFENSVSFSSHLTGKIKPDPEAFEHVVDMLGCEPPEVLFLDDNLPNVEAARLIGMQAQRVRGVEESRAVLETAGIL